MKRLICLLLILLTVSCAAFAETWDDVFPADDYLWCRRGDAFYFCRADGTPVVDHSWPIGGDLPAFPYSMFLQLSDNRIALCFGADSAQGPWGIIDADGSIVAEPLYNRITDKGNGAVSVTKDGKYGLINADTGELITQIQYDYIRSFSEIGLAAFQTGDLWGYIDHSGNHAIEAVFDAAQSFSPSGVAVISENGRFGIIDATGNYTLQPQYDEIISFTESAFIAVKDGKYGLITSDNTLLTGFDYDETSPYSRMIPYLSVRQGDLWGFIDHTGHPVTPVIYDEALHFSTNGTAAVCLNGQWGFIDVSGSYLLEPQFEEATNIYPEGFAIVRKNGLYGCITASGEWIVKPEYDDIHASANCNISKYQTWEYTKEAWHAVKGDEIHYFDVCEGEVVPPLP